MTANRAFKRRVRARAARTGESYTAALRHLRAAEGAIVTTTISQSAESLRIAVAQTTPLEDPADVAGIRARGREIRALMRGAHDGGAHLLHLPEAALCFPSKTLMSSVPGVVAESDWRRFAWAAHTEEVAAIRAEARRLGMWTVLGAVQRAADEAAGSRPRLSMLVIGPGGAIEARYDERLLSRTKQSFMYAAGHEPATFAVEGITFGCISGLEGLFGDLISEYEAEGVDCVLYSTAGPVDPGAERSLADSAAVAARQNGVWVSYAVHADKAPDAPAGVVGPDGGWVATCAAQARAGVVVVEVGRRPESGAREWRREMLAAHREHRVG